MNNAIEFREVAHTLNDRDLVARLSFTVQPGDTLVLLGRSGCGKTTTLKLVNGLILPTSGEVRVAERPTTQWDLIQLRRQMGYVIQDVGLFPHFTVARNIGLVPSLLGWAAGRIQSRVYELLEMVGLNPTQFARRYPHQLSGGQRQRVGVARALAADPPFLLMDEPFGALDPITRLELQQEFLLLQQRLRKTIVFVTHDVQEALLLGTQVGLMQSGELLSLTTPAGFLASASSETQAFLKGFHHAADLRGSLQREKQHHD
ncbi:ATP-binding cassette domain-containing protein [Altericista sp. CCNU0014]|uniref:ATP-binding cassette domain-containing protein n=1 Tax=Altericista sp. CCNU0014 TaxID=3082949 RepID=UPI00384DBCCA